MSYENEYYLVEIGYGFKSAKGKGFSRGDYVPVKTINNFIKKRNSHSVFHTVYRYKDIEIESAKQIGDVEIQNASLYGDLYLDFDDISCYENVKADAITALSYLKIIYHINDNQVKIYFSGNKGVHIIVPAEILGVKPMISLNGVFRNIAISINTFSKNKTIDTQIYDNKRMFRIPNTIHEKSGLYKVPITATELRTLSEAEIRDLAKSPRDIKVEPVVETNNIARQAFEKCIIEFQIMNNEAKKDKRFNAKLTIIPPCIQYLLDNGAIEGQRNITIACLASFWRNYGKSLDETIETISEWNSGNSAPTGLMELKRTVRSIFMGQKSYGCSTLKLTSICDSDKCKLSKKKEVNKNVIRS